MSPLMPSERPRKRLDPRVRFITGWFSETLRPSCSLLPRWSGRAWTFQYGVPANVVSHKCPILCPPCIKNRRTW